MSKKQFSDKETYTNLAIVDIPLTIIDEAICKTKDVVSPMSKKISSINISKQVNLENIKSDIKKDQLIRVPYRHPNHKVIN